MSGLHGGFPHLALLLFSVAHEAEDLVLSAVDAGGERHAHGDAQALAERAGETSTPGSLSQCGWPWKGE